MKAIKQFFTNRLNKDNFWNMMLPLGWSVGFIIALTSLRLNTGLAIIISLIVLCSMIFLVKHKQAITFDLKNKQFLKADGTAIQKQPIWLRVLSVSGAIFLVMLTPSVLSAMDNATLYLLMLLFILLAAIPFAFCILNYPISIMFNQHMWQGNGDGINYRSSSSIHNSSIGHKAFCSSNSTTSLSYSSLSSNIHSSRY